MSFTQLQTISSYSLLDSNTRIDALVDDAKKKGYDAIALTDINVMHGVIDFYKESQKVGIKPIIGLTIDVMDDYFKEQTQWLLLAKNETGYKNLLKISTKICTSEQKPFFSEIKDQLADVITIIPAENSSLAKRLSNSDETEIEHYLATLNANLPDFYLGVSLQKKVLDNVLPLKTLQKKGYELVALGNVQYLSPDDAFSVTTLRAIRDKQTLQSFANADGEYALPNVETQTKLFEKAELEAAIANTEKIAQQCQVQIEFKKVQLPHFKTPQNQSSANYLQQLAQTGLKARFNTQPIPDDYQKRLNYELGVIEKMGFSDYFLIIWDVMNYAHRVNIMTGPGRGSAAGSLVSYALKITEVDPIKYELLFERFLNPNRANMPDIDLDIPDNRRNELLQYVHEKYGTNHMAQIITFGTLGAKMVIRDVGRVFGISKFEIDEWAKAIPRGFKITLKVAYQESERLRYLIEKSSKNQLLFKTAVDLEGLPRQDSIHAAGIVISETALTDSVPLQNGSEGIEKTQFEMGDVESLGLLKMDFLGLRNLTTLASVISSIKHQTGKLIDPKQIPLDDKETLALFQRGDTDGIFQFESAGIRQVLRRLHPTSFMDIVATDALYRPGPMENIPAFIERKHNEKETKYLSSSLKPILGSTYGILVYQEQVMQVASIMGGFTLGEADILRRAISKKKKAIIDENRTRFIQGAIKKGYSENEAQQVYAYIEQFANYGFNKSHAVAYSMIAFWLAYLKVHFPLEFLVSLLNSVIGNDPKIRSYLVEAKKQKINVLSPDINQSQRYFSITDQGIQFGFLCIKGVRRDLATELIDLRKQEGRFKSLLQFVQALPEKYRKAENFKPLVYSGAFDEFGTDRNEIYAELSSLMETANFANNNIELFKAFEPKKTKVAALTTIEKLDLERELLGQYVSGNPLDKYQRLIQLYSIFKIDQLKINQEATILATIKRVKTIHTKKGMPMAFLTVQDDLNDLSVTIFPELYRTVSNMLEKGTTLLISGKLESRNDEKQMIAQKIQLADQVLESTPAQTLYLKMTDENQLPDVQQLLKEHPGNVPVVIYDQSNAKSFLMNRKFWVEPNDTLISLAEKKLGSGSVILKTVSKKK